MTFQPRHIVVPVACGANDDIAIAEHLVDAAADVVAGKSGARMTILFAFTPRTMLVPFDAGGAPGPAYAAMAEVWELNRATAQQALDKLRTRVEPRGIAVATELIEPLEGTGEAIAHAAAKLGADLVVLASHGRRGLQRLFLGSVAERVAHLSPVPVLIFRTSAIS